MARHMIAVPFGPHGQTVSRLSPLGDPRAYKTYGAVMPLRTHFRPGTCEEYGCDAWRSGWVTTVDLSTDLGQQQAHYIMRDKTRSASMQRVSLTLVKFVYAPGQQCFTAHRVPSGRPPRFLVRSGDWRGNPDGFRREHRNGTPTGSAASTATARNGSKTSRKLSTACAPCASAANQGRRQPWRRPAASAV